LSEHPEWQFIGSMMIPLMVVAAVSIMAVLMPLLINLLKKLRRGRVKPPSEQSQNTFDVPEVEPIVTEDNALLLNESRDIGDARASLSSSSNLTVSESILRAVLFIAFASYISLTDEVLAVLPCENGHMVKYPWVACSWEDGTYAWLILSASFFLLIYILGIPIVFTFLLIRYRPVEDEQERQGSLAMSVKFLYEDYRVEMHYFEIVWMARRFLLVLAVTLIPAMSPWQATLALSVLIVSIFLQTLCRPFAKSSDNLAELLAALGLIFLYSMSWILYLYPSYSALQYAMVGLLCAEILSLVLFMFWPAIKNILFVFLLRAGLKAMRL
jgi:hypothetical protein